MLQVLGEPKVRVVGDSLDAVIVGIKPEFVGECVDIEDSNPVDRFRTIAFLAFRPRRHGTSMKENAMTPDSVWTSVFIYFSKQQ